jgi:hypothetical protein
VNIFLDDVRDSPDDSWVLVRNVKSCLKLLKTETVDTLSLDHDLGSEKIEETGYAVLLWIERRIISKKSYVPPRSIIIHSANPVGRDRMYAAIKSILKLLEKR